MRGRTAVLVTLLGTAIGLYAGTKLPPLRGKAPISVTAVTLCGGKVGFLFNYRNGDSEFGDDSKEAIALAKGLQPTVLDVTPRGGCPRIV